MKMITLNDYMINNSITKYRLAKILNKNVSTIKSWNINDLYVFEDVSKNKLKIFKIIS